jgi:uncharacterized SAM-binding protein YcdF (DUF218 family)
LDVTGHEWGESTVHSREIGVGRLLKTVVVAVALLWAGGFVYFVDEIGHLKAPENPSGDGIVVLTGGAQRLNVAINLLQSGEARRLLISGVHSRISADDLSTVTIGTKPLFECCVDLGRSALNTQGNAREAADWAAERGYKRLIIVTANYHMPRSLLEFHKAMPGVTLTAYPVSPGELKLDHWWLHAGTTSLLAGEYSKYLLALLRVGPAGTGR